MPRLEVAVVKRDGSAQIVNASRPASLVAFSDAHDGKVMPETIREIAFVVHHAMGLDEPLDDWIASLEDLSAFPEDVARAKRIIAGDEHAKRVALGEEEEEEEESSDPSQVDPLVEQIDEEARTEILLPTGTAGGS
jgi:hypothetical protein